MLSSLLASTCTPVCVYFCGVRFLFQFEGAYRFGTDVLDRDDGARDAARRLRRGRPPRRTHGPPPSMQPPVQPQLGSAQIDLSVVFNARRLASSSSFCILSILQNHPPWSFHVSFLVPLLSVLHVLPLSLTRFSSRILRRLFPTPPSPPFCITQLPSAHRSSTPAQPHHP